MTAVVAYDDVAVGFELPPVRVRLQRVNLVMYAGASGDFNPIHWNGRIATAVGLPDVIAHGMLTMASAGRIVTDWTGDPGAVEDYSVRFAAPVVVPDDDRGTVVDVTARVTERLPGHHIRVDITATVAGPDGEPGEVLKQAHALVRLA